MQAVFVDATMDASDLQSIINTSPVGTTIRLAAGTYVFDQTVSIDRSGISLVGAGSAKTTIIADPALGSAPAIQIGHALHRPIVEADYALSAHAQAGDTSVLLEPGHGARVGDYLYLTQENTAEYFAEIGDSEWQQDKNLRTVLAKVVTVEGAMVEIDTTLPFDFDPAITIVEQRTIIENNTLGGFAIQGGWGASDPSDFSNTEPTALGNTMVMVGGTGGVTLTDITITDAASHGLTVGNSTQLIADGISVDGAANKGVSGSGYGLWIRDVYDSTFRDLEITDMRHAVVFASYTSAAGNDVHILHTNRDVNFHGGRDQGNVVTVDSSVRTGVEANFLAPTVFVNGGTSYGAPTDPLANEITFKFVAGTIRSETVASGDFGGEFHLEGGPDTAITGAGDDHVTLGTGNDTAFASVGVDTLIGGPGDDTVRFEFGLNAYATSWDNEALVVTRGAAETRLLEFEWVTFGAEKVDFFDVEAAPLVS